MSNNKPEILVIIHDFPPYMNGGSVIRTVKYIKYLKDRVNFYVVCAKQLDKECQETFNEVLKDVDVLYIEDPLRGSYKKVQTSQSQEIYKNKQSASLKNRILSSLKIFVNDMFIPDKHFFWYRSAYKKFLQEWGDKKFDAVYSTFPEASAHYLGYRISKKLKIPHLLDYRDLWSTNDLFKRKIPLLNFINVVTEKHIINNAERVFFATEHAMNLYKEKGYLKEDKSVVLWNGFDPDDLDRSDCLTKKDDCQFRIIYAGVLGSLNKPRRSPKAFLEALNSKEIKSLSLDVDIFGSVPEDVYEYIENKTENVNFHGNISHKKVFKELQKSDVALVLLTKIEDLSAVPGKVYEYMAMNKFILALTERDGQLGQIVTEYGFGMVVSPTDPLEIKSAIIKIFHRLKLNNNENVQVDFLNRFNRKETAAKLLCCIEKIV